MSELRAKLQEYGHPDVIVGVDPRWSKLADWLPSYFAAEVRNGVRFAPEQTVQIGWSFLKLAATPDGDLAAFEPDFETMPVHWVEGVSRSVRLLAVQRAVCDHCQVDPVFPSILQPAFSAEVMPGAHQFTLVRSEAEGNHSGWTFHGRSDAGMRLLSLYEAATINRAIVPFLALPAGSVVERNDKVLSVSMAGRHYSSGSSELLSRLAAGKPIEGETTV
jgi:hypothetical protein